MHQQVGKNAAHIMGRVVAFGFVRYNNVKRFFVTRRDESFQPLREWGWLQPQQRLIDRRIGDGCNPVIAHFDIDLSEQMSCVFESGLSDGTISVGQHDNMRLDSPDPFEYSQFVPGVGDQK